MNKDNPNHYKSEQLIELKKSLRGKILMKNFSNAKVVLVTTIPAQKTVPE